MGIKGLFRKRKNKRKFKIFTCLPDNCGQDNANYYKNIISRLNNISHPSKICCLGSTINAAFVELVMKGKIDYFVDENPNKIDTVFYGKKVLHTENLKNSDLDILPYGKTNEIIKTRFEQKYKGQYLCL